MPDPICGIIQPPKKGLYQGAYAPDPASGRAEITSEKSINDFEQMSGTDLAILVRFIKFGEGLNFPTQWANFQAKKGGTIFIKLEPWSGKGKNDKSFSLEKILDGKFDHLLKRFAEGAKKFGRPIFVSFGHEMNGSHYPWAGNPELYKRAYQYVHDKISKYGACNITWVWNPDIEAPAREYYPGDEQVGWIATDGYNWSGTTPASQIFSGALREIKLINKTNKPVMIGEFGCANDNASCLTDFVDFAADPANNIRAYIYFNRDKEEKWAILNNAERQAYRDAILKHQALFNRQIQAAAPPATPGQPAKPALPAVQLTMPAGFKKISFFPETLIGKNVEKVGASQKRVDKNLAHIQSNITSGDLELGDEGTVQYRVANFSEYIIQWMLKRENGKPDPTLLDKSYEAYKSFNYAAYGSPYWRTKVALLIISGNPSVREIEYLKKIGFAQNIKTAGKKPDDLIVIPKAEKFKALREIYAQYISHKQQRHEPVDSVLKGEIEIQLAALSPNKKTEKDYIKLAGDTLDEIIKNPQETRQNEIYNQVHKRMIFCSGAERPRPDLIKTEFNFSQGWARALKAQAILFRAGNKVDPREALKDFQEAYALLQKAAENKDIKGLHYQQVKRLAAECLILTGFILKDYGKEMKISDEVTALTKKLVEDIYKWEQTTGTISTQDYSALFRAARALIEGVPNESVLDWEVEYNKLVPNPANRPLWLKQIVAYAKIWKTKMQMVVAGEYREGLPKEYIPRQGEMLRHPEKTLRAVLSTANVLDPESMADVKRSLGEILARRAFVLLDMGKTTEALKLFNGDRSSKDRIDRDGALGLLNQAITGGKPEVKAEARLWLAKIYLVNAGKIENKKKRENLLAQGLAEVDNSFGSDYLGISLLKGTVLSSAYQTKGDLLSALKRFDEAKAALQKAIDVFPKNDFARAALGDVLNWQGNHSEAIKVYNKVPKKSPAYPRAQIGFAEASMRLNETYDPKAIGKLEEQTKKIFTSETPASPLIPRAIQDLIEAYRTDEDLQNRIVYIGKKLLGIEAKVDLEEAEIKALDEILDKISPEARAAFEPKFRAEIYLRTAEALLWRKQFDPVLALLEKDKMSEYQTALQNNPELLALKELIAAETKMRKEKEAAPFLKFLSGESRPAQIAVEEKDPDLAERIVLGLIEAHSLEKEWDKAIEAAQNPVIPLKKMKELFADRKLGYEKFRFRLRFRLVEAYIGNKDFAKARDELISVISDAQDVRDKRESYLAPLADRTKAEAYLLLGNLYSYRWSGQDFNASRDSYNKAVDLLKDKDPSKEGRIILAKTYRGLGEIYRYGGKKLSDYDRQTQYYRSKLYYDLAKDIAEDLPKRSDDRKILLSRIYLGLAKLEQQEVSRRQAVIYFDEAKKYGKSVPDDDELQAEIERTGAFLKDHYLKLENQSFFDRSGRIENRFLAEVQLPLFKGTLVLPTLSYQLDSASGLSVHNLYVGAKLRPLEIFDVRSHALTLEGKFKVEPLEKNVYSDPRAEMKYFRQQDAIFVASYENKWIVIVGSAAVNRKESDYNSYYANFRVNLSSNVQLGGEWWRGPFTLSGEKIIRDDVNLAVWYNLDLADLFLDNYDQAKVRLNLAYPYGGFENGKSVYSPKGFKAGLGLDVHLGKGVVLVLDCAWVNQKSYSYGLCTTGLRW